MACVNENVYWLEWGQVRSVPTSVPMLKKVFELMISIWHFKVRIHSPYHLDATSIVVCRLTTGTGIYRQ